MKNEHDRLIREKLTAASPEDLGYRPERERIWEATGRKRKREVRRFPLWLTHAAALAAGVMLGVVLLTRYDRPVPDGYPPSVTTVPAPAFTIHIPADGNAVQNKETRATEHTATHRQGRTATHSTAAPGTSNEDAPLSADKMPIAVTPADPPVAGGEEDVSHPQHIARAQMRTIHLVDIGNENSGQAAARATTVWERFFPDRESGQDIAAAPAIVFHDYFTRSRK